jgi:SAM-dependent methyltransferase
LNRRPPRPKRGALPTALHPDTLICTAQSSIISMEVIVKDSHLLEKIQAMLNDLVRIHHADYQEDLPFWLAWTDGRDPILELGCGHGRVTLPLLKAGHQVVGLDLDQDSLRYLTGLLASSDQDLRSRAVIIQADMLKYQPRRKFEAVLIPCNTYSIFSEIERQTLLKNVRRALLPTGILIASVPNPALLKALVEDMDREDLEPEEEKIFPHPETGYPVQVSSCLHINVDAVSWDWIYDHMFPDGKVDRTLQSTSHHLCSPEKYYQELSQAGFGNITFLGDFNGGAFDDQAPYLILICKIK